MLVSEIADAMGVTSGYMQTPSSPLKLLKAEGKVDCMRRGDGRVNYYADPDITPMLRPLR